MPTAPTKHPEPPAASPLWIALNPPRIGWRQRVVTPTGRWDAAFLACLAEAPRDPLAPGLDAAAMAAAMAAHGLARKLAPTEFGRLLLRLNRQLAELTADSGLSACITHPPRGKTGGPWRLQTDLPVVLRRPASSAPATPRPTATVVEASRATAWLALSVSDAAEAPVRLATRFKRGMELLWKAIPEPAIQLLADGPGWDGESEALAALRRLRLAEALMTTGQTDAAAACLAQAQAGLVQPELRTLFLPQIAVVALRVDYASNPVKRYAPVLAQLSSHLARCWSDTSPRVDVQVWAENLHLTALCQRRQLELELEPHTPAGQRAAQAMRRSFEAALLLNLLIRNNERAQHVCANLAYAHQKLALAVGAPHWALAVDWHALSFAMHTTFGGAESSAWEYIYIGELWLSSPEAQAAFRHSLLHTGWNDVAPHRLTFYQDACRIARQLNDARQIAYTLLNRYRFVIAVPDRAAVALRADALAELQDFLRRHPAQHRLLLAEGYPLPKLEPVR